MYAHTPEEPDLPRPAQNSWGTASVIAALPAPHTAAPLLLRAAGDNPGAQAEEGREGRMRQEGTMEGRRVERKEKGLEGGKDRKKGGRGGNKESGREGGK